MTRPTESEIVFVRALRSTYHVTCLSVLPVVGGAQSVSDNRLLVPVSDTETLRQTVEYAVQTAVGTEADTPATVRFVYLNPARANQRAEATRRTAEKLLDRVAVWAREDAGGRELVVETIHLGADRYIFSPADVANALVTEARGQNRRRVVLDPEYDPGIGAMLVQPLEGKLAGVEGIGVETAPVERQTRRTPVFELTTLGEIGTLFGISFVFYQVLAGNVTWLAANPVEWADKIYWLDIVTGTISATVAAVALSQVTLSTAPTRRSVGRVLRGLVYLPYLLVEIVKTNILVAAVILNPQITVEPRLTRVRPALWGGLPMAVLANSITLTPGTLSVRITGRSLLVHTLVPRAREGLVDGGLERAVRFVFYGRGAMRMPSLRERGEADPVPADHVRPVDEQSGDDGNGTDTAGSNDTDGGEGR